MIEYVYHCDICKSIMDRPVKTIRSIKLPWSSEAAAICVNNRPIDICETCATKIEKFIHVIGTSKDREENDNV